MAAGNHLSQEAYIRDIVGSGEFLIFSQDLYTNKFVWKLSSNYKDKKIMYEANYPIKIKHFDPELNGKGTNEVFSRIEQSVHRATCTYNYLDGATYQEKLEFGIQLLARFGAQIILEENGCVVNGNNFTDIFNLLKEQSQLNDICSEIKIKCLLITYPQENLIISDTPIIYSHSYMCYPINSKTLLWIGQDNENNENIINSLKDNVGNWINFICNEAKLYLIAHKSLDKEIQEAIKNCYEQGIFNFAT